MNYEGRRGEVMDTEEVERIVDECYKSYPNGCF